MMQSPKHRSVRKKPVGGLIPLPARRKFSKSSPRHKTPKGSSVEKQQIPQPSDHKFAIGEKVTLYFDDKARTILGAHPWKNAKPSLSKVSTIGKVIHATNTTATVAFKRPTGSFSAAMRSASPMSAEGGVPLFALMNSNFVADKGERFDTKSTAPVGTTIQVYFDPISGKMTDEKTIYTVPGRIVKPGVVETVQPEIKTIVVKGTLPLGKRVELFVEGGKTSLKRMSDKSTRLPGTVVHTSDGVSTLSYKIPNKREGQYVQRYSPTNITGKFVTDPRFIRQLSPDAQRQIAMFKPPVPPLCVGQTFNPRDSNNCFVKGMEARLKPVIDLKRKFKGTAGGGAGNPFCDFGNPKVQAHQTDVYEFARILATRSPKEIGGIRGMLCYHSVGSGKTATSLGIALAFWNTKRNIVLATTPENMNDNNHSVYAENLFKFFPDYVKVVFKDKPLPEFTRAPFNRQVQAFGKTMTADKALQEWCKIKPNIQPLARRIKTRSFTTLASSLGFQGQGAIGRANPEGEQFLMGKHGRLLPGNPQSGAIGSVLIMDEVQSLFKPMGNDEYKKAANWLRTELTNPKYKKHMYVFALTGTPGGTVQDILSVINFVRPLNVPRIKPQDLNRHPEWLKGYVSYVELRGDTSTYGIKNVQNVFIEMDPKYYTGFLKTIKTLTEKEIGADKRPGYMKNAIGAGDALTTKTAISGVYSKEEIERLTRRDMTGGIPAAVKFGPKIAILSPKLREVIKRVLSIKGKQYMYVINPSTAFAVMAVLDTIGFTGVNPANPEESMSSPRNRYVYYKAGSYTYKGKTMKVEKKELSGMKNALKNPKNINGEYIKLVIATGTFYQGFDTPGLTGVHLVDPLHDSSADVQAVGRALRMCQHKNAASKTANVFRYFSTPPKEFSRDGVAAKTVPQLEATAKKILSLNVEADMRAVNGPPSKMGRGVNSFVFADAVRKNKPVAQTEMLLKAMAVDCKVFKDVFHSKENFQCGKPVFVDIESAKSPRTPAKRSPSGLLRMSPMTPRKSSSPIRSSSARGSVRSKSSIRSPSAKLQVVQRYSPSGGQRYGTTASRSPVVSSPRRYSAPARIPVQQRTVKTSKPISPRTPTPHRPGTPITSNRRSRSSMR